MKHKGFTLIELLVVVAIIVLLVAMLAPTLATAMAFTRAAVCRANLHRLGEAFVLAGNLAGNTNASTAAHEEESGQAGYLYPSSMLWPIIPKNVVSEAGIYRCPEDEDPESGQGYQALLGRMEYSCPYGNFYMDTIGTAEFYKSRRGVNSQDGTNQAGPYTEYLLQDDLHSNNQWNMMNFNGWIDTDGGIRIFDSGHIFVFSALEDDTAYSVPDWSYTVTTYGRGPGWPNRMNTCPEKNDVLINGFGAFSGDPRPQGHRGETFALPNWGDLDSSYGISSAASKYSSGSGSIVLVDYEYTIVYVDGAADRVGAGAELVNSARHMGRVNYLTVGGTVESATPQAISPLTQPQRWTP